MTTIAASGLSTGMKIRVPEPRFRPTLFGGVVYEVVQLTYSPHLRLVQLLLAKDGQTTMVTQALGADAVVEVIQ